MIVALWICALTQLTLIVALLNDRRQIQRDMDQLRRMYDMRWKKSGQRMLNESLGLEPTDEQADRLTPGVSNRD